MKKLLLTKAFMRVGLPGGLLLGFSGCGLSDAQLASIWQSVLTTAFTTMATQLLSALFGGGA